MRYGGTPVCQDNQEALDLRNKGEAREKICEEEKLEVRRW